MALHRRGRIFDGRSAWRPLRLLRAVSGVGLAWALCQQAGSAFGFLGPDPALPTSSQSAAAAARASGLAAGGQAATSGAWGTHRGCRQDPRTALAAVEGVTELLLAAGPAGGALEPWAGLESSALLSFADQGQNINGVLFQASLLPYLLFLYFLGYRGNNTPPLVQFGFSFLLLFVLATIPTGIISKSTFGLILADSDWLHGSAESLLTCTNLLLVLGFRGALMGDAATADSQPARNIAGAWAVAVVATIAAGIPLFGAEGHTPFLGGIGAMSMEGLASVAEPVNALSLPTWLVHWSSVFEFLIAMTLAWRYAAVTGNERWKGLTWGMLPSHASSVAALTFHVFYNQIPWILTAQAAFTLMGNITLCIAALRIAVSNGWTIDELNPLPALKQGWDRLTGAEGEASLVEAADVGLDLQKLKTTLSEDDLLPAPLFVLEVVFLTTFAAYATKYGELLFNPALFQGTDVVSNTAAALIVLVLPLLTAATAVSRSSDLQQGSFPPLAIVGGAQARGEER